MASLRVKLLSAFLKDVHPQRHTRALSRLERKLLLKFGLHILKQKQKKKKRKKRKRKDRPNLWRSFRVDLCEVQFFRSLRS